MRHYIPRGYNPCPDYYPPNPYFTMSNMMPSMPVMERPHYYPNETRCPMGSRPHIVRTGDTLYSLAYSYETTIDEIMRYNPQITDPNRIYVGQVICMPYQQECDGMLYTIAPGDTLYAIAMKYNLTIEDILAVNPQIVNPNLIYPGQEICLPGVSPCPEGMILFVVRPTDTLTTILTDCKVSLNALKAANPTFDENNIVPGTQLCVIPTPCEPPCPPEKQSIIPKGVNGLTAVAEHYVVSTNDLLKYNPNYPPCYFISGHPICVPPEVPV